MENTLHIAHTMHISGKDNMGREKEIELYLTRRVKESGGLSYKWVSPGVNGVPDRIVMMNGKISFIELKQPKEKARALQAKEMQKIRDQGFDARLIDTRDKVDQLLLEMTGKYA